MTEDMVSVSVLSSCSFDLLEYCSRGQIQGYVHPVREACFVVLRPGQHVRVLESTHVFWTARKWRLLVQGAGKSVHCSSSFRARQLVKRIVVIHMKNDASSRTCGHQLFHKRGHQWVFIICGQNYAWSIHAVGQTQLCSLDRWLRHVHS